MRISHNISERSTLLARLLNFPSVTIEWFLWRVCKFNYCEVHDEAIVLRSSLFTRSRIPASEIKRWSIHAEMGFDVVSVELVGGESLILTDKHDDVMDCLRQIAREKQIEIHE